MALAKSDVDDVLNIVNILREGWDTDNVAKPMIHDVTLVSQPTKRDLRQNDKIFVYEASYAENIRDIGYNNIGWVKRISIDIRTALAPPRIYDLWKEVRRCLWNKRKTPTDDDSANFPFCTIEGLTRNNLSDGSKGYYRIVYDVELKKMTEAVST